MPRIPAVLAVLAAVAFCIGFNTVRYPAVWEMLKQPGLPLATSQPPDASAPAQAAPKPPAPGAAKTTAASTRGAKKARQADAQPEFCTADGVCSIAGGPQATGKQGQTTEPRFSTQGTGSPPDLPRDASLAGLGGSTHQSPHAAESAASGAPPSPEPPKPPPQRSPSPASGQLARVERPLVPVPEGPWPSPGLSSSPGESHGGVGPGNRAPPNGGPTTRAGNPRLRPLPPVGDLVAPPTGPAGAIPASGPVPVYPTTGYPSVDLSRMASGPSGNLVPVSGHGG